MADNRMAIICKRCKLGIAIAKIYLGQDWGRYPLNASRTNAFFEKHAGCGEQGYGTHQYRLGYEDEDDWVYDTVGLDKHKG